MAVFAGNDEMATTTVGSSKRATALLLSKMYGSRIVLRLRGHDHDLGERSCRLILWVMPSKFYDHQATRE